MLINLIDQFVHVNVYQVYNFPQRQNVLSWTNISSMREQRQNWLNIIFSEKLHLIKIRNSLKLVHASFQTSLMSYSSNFMSTLKHSTPELQVTS